MSDVESIQGLLARPEGHVTIGFAGDIMIGRLVNERLRQEPLEYLWGDLLPLLQATDVNIGNLEAALTTSDEKVDKVFNFKSDPKNVETLSLARIPYVNIANNHVLDYSYSGFYETLETLEAAGVRYCGAGRDSGEATRPVIFEQEGITIGMLGLTDNEPSWNATERSPGTRYVQIGDIGAVEDDIAQLRENVDIVIISMHWGPNMRERPVKAFVDFAHQLSDRGVDIIHGHSAHIFQGVERYQDTLILYDTGDFVDDYRVDPELRNDRSFFFCVEVSKKGVEKLVMIPTRISDCQVNLSTGIEREETLRRMQQLSLERGAELEVVDGCLILRPGLLT